MLRLGEQDAIKVRIKSARSIEEIVGNVTQYLEADSAVLMNMLANEKTLEPLFNEANTISLFLPDTYELYWSTNEEKLLTRMQREYDKYWNETRRKKAKAKNLNPQQVLTLAAIVNEETNKTDEMPRIAGVYLNRLKRGMRLQADPTVKFAVGDWSLKRILNKHLAVESPYNTSQFLSYFT